MKIMPIYPHTLWTSIASIHKREIFQLISEWSQVIQIMNIWIWEKLIELRLRYNPRFKMRKINKERIQFRRLITPMWELKSLSPLNAELSVANPINRITTPVPKKITFWMSHPQSKSPFSSQISLNSIKIIVYLSILINCKKQIKMSLPLIKNLWSLSL